MTDINQWIDNEVKTNDVVLFMKGTADMPMCGFSGKATQILNHLGVTFKSVNVLDSNDIRQGIKDYTNWPTVPQLYVKGEFVGGTGKSQCRLCRRRHNLPGRVYLLHRQRQCR